jgi:hypothetical protein
MPSQLLGTDPSCNLSVNSFCPQPNDRLLLISRSAIPSQFYNLTKDRHTIDAITEVFAQDDPDLPFWIGHLDF